jgi:hypothetical protein
MDEVDMPMAEFVTLPVDDANRLVAEHPELADTDGTEPVIVAISARDRAEAAELGDLVTAARRLLRDRSRTAQQVLDLLLPSDRLTLGPGLLRQVERNARAEEALAAEFGLLTSAEVAALAGSKAANAAALASRWRKDGQIFGVEVKGVARYAGFQFGPDGRPRSLIRQVLDRFGGALSDWELALWWTGANGWLGGARPVDVIDATPAEQAEVLHAAGMLADELAE